uniref:Uncharacterized protein n=1 Tax=Sphaerodactylus townsendi TaxID=933632 RepID=A0ACB8EGU7_9SAUR
MPFQPRGVPKARRRRTVPEGAQQTASLEAIGLLPSAAGALGRGSALPTASVTTQPGCTMRVSVTPSFRKRWAHMRHKEDPTWLEKEGAAVKNRDKTVIGAPGTPRLTRMALPQLPKAGGRQTEKPVLPARLSRAKGGLPPNDDMAPWTGASHSEAASFHALFTPMVSTLHGVPCSSAGPPGFRGFFPDLGGQASAPEGEQRRRTKQLQGGRAKQKGQGRCFPRHFKSKRQGGKLPPVPSITPLNFSRNFTFSFFELPPYQIRQHWAQCQQLLSLFMKQLE